MTSTDYFKAHPSIQEFFELPSSPSIIIPPMPEHELELIEGLKFWVNQHPKKPSNVALPTTHVELVSFVARIFLAFQKEEQEAMTQLNSLHLLTPSMLQLYQKKFIQIHSMNWIQLMCYKVVACPHGKVCQTFREQKMLHNQFYDFELECPFYHDKKDRRRLILPEKHQEEFMYKGKYQEGISEENMDASYSYNYFESVFHPLFYKFFDCKRVQCKGSIYCPMKHSDDERVAWEEEFSLNWRKDRSIYYPKKKKNSFEGSETSQEDRPSHNHKQYRKNNENGGKQNRRNNNYNGINHNNGNNNYNVNNNGSGNQNNFNKQDRRNRACLSERQIKTFNNKENHEQPKVFESQDSKESKFLKIFSSENTKQSTSSYSNTTYSLFNFEDKENCAFFDFQDTTNEPIGYSNTSQKKYGFHNNNRKECQNQNIRSYGNSHHIEVK